jgi:hypothetical protein
MKKPCYGFNLVQTSGFHKGIKTLADEGFDRTLK